MVAKPRAEEAPRELWWRSLPENFHQMPPHTGVDAHDSAQVKAAAVVDTGLRTLLSMLISGGLAALIASPERLNKEIRRLGFYREILDRARQDQIFLPPPKNVEIHTASTRMLGYRPKNIPSHILTFSTPFEPLNPAMREDYRRHHHNTRVIAQHWDHPDGPRPTLIFIHGFMIDAYWLNAEMFALRWFYRKGYDILLYTLPFHGSRRHRASVLSGLGYVTNGVCHLNEAMLQSVFDLRILIRHLRKNGVKHVGLSGISLGGYISALTASVEKNITFCVPNSPAVLPTEMALGWWPSGPILRYLMDKTGLSLNELRHSVALHNPLSWNPKPCPDCLLIIAGAADRFVSPQHIRLLHEHWRGSELHWFPGNHLMHFKQRQYLKLMLKFMNHCCNRNESVP